MKLDIAKDDLFTTLTPKVEKLDSNAAPDLKSQLILLSKATDSGDLIIDLSHVNFADSSGLSALLLANRLYRDVGRTLVLCSLHEKIARLIDISRLTSAFNIEDDQEAAAAFIKDQYEDDSDS